MINPKAQQGYNPEGNERLRVVVSGGGTGGHIYPALAIAEALKKRYDADILYMGSKYDLHGRPSHERKLAGDAGWPYIGVFATGLSRRSPRILFDILLNYCGVLEAKKHIANFAPHIVIGTGGYAMAPVVRAAAGLKVPTLLHEQNAYPGWANRYLAKKVDMICLTFQASQPYFHPKTRVRVTGIPVRHDVLKMDREEAYEFWGIKETERERPTLLVMGGSQGAQHLNEAICLCYKELLSAGLRIIHLTGENHIEACRKAAGEFLQQENLHILPYLTEMRHALSLADLAVGRAGASFLAEIAVAGVPSILVPYPYAANDHQTLNALSFTALGASLLVKNEHLDGASLSQLVLELINDKSQLQKMSAAAKTLAEPYAIDAIIDVVMELVQKNK